MKIEDEIYFICGAPLQQTVGHRKTFFQPRVFSGNFFVSSRQREEIVVNRNSHGIEAPGSQGVNVDFACVIFKPGAVKEVRLLLTHKVLYIFTYHMLLLPDTIHSKHIPFLKHPAAQSYASKNNLLTLTIDNVWTVASQKTLRP